MANFSDVTAALAEAGVLHQYPSASEAFDGVLRLLETQGDGQAGLVLEGPSRQIATGLLQVLAGGAQPLEHVER